MKVELIKPHTHAGESLSPGQIIDVSKAQAAWLFGLGVAKEITTKRKSKEIKNAVN